jgi:hypothetical protein
MASDAITLSRSKLLSTAAISSLVALVAKSSAIPEPVPVHPVKESKTINANKPLKNFFNLKPPICLKLVILIFAKLMPTFYHRRIKA